MKILLLHGEDALEPPPEPVLDQIADALRAGGHEVSRHALRDVATLTQAVAVERPDLVFNLVESFGGRSAMDASVASLLNLLDLRYTGSSHTGLTIAGDKTLTKKILTFHGIRIPRFATLHRGGVESTADLEFPLIVKPPQEDASIGITSGSVVNGITELLERIDALHREYHAPVLVEEFIDGREFYVSVLGNERAQALPVAELDMSAFPAGVPRVATFDAKWQEQHADFQNSRTVFPDDLPAELVAAMQQAALDAFHGLRLRDYARIDLRVTDAADIFVIEVNPNCYLERDEVFAQAASRAGLDYDALIARIVELASSRYAR
ncbi:MAG: D-alanine--D-alanine ligase family protein [Longimicrobiales bacterium]